MVGRDIADDIMLMDVMVGIWLTKFNNRIFNVRRIGEKMKKEIINQITAIEIIKEELNDYTNSEVLEEILKCLGINTYIVESTN